ncbi:hypothetical protein [Streptomyces sp. NPDC056468]|uniref:hypothetical protein n=1 Tax=unclassified Streptomyces TaxID=2593676 RepID=UPI0036A191DB
MRSTPSLRIIAAALLTGGTLAVATTGTTAVANDRGGDRSGIECQFRGHHFDNDPFWHLCPDFGDVSVNVIVIVTG